MEDDDLPPDLLRLVAQDEKQILPHQEVTEAINLGTEEERKEVDSPKRVYSFNLAPRNIS